MATYRVKPGYWHGAANQYGPGDNIELSVEEAAGFLDKLVLVEEGDDRQPTTDDGQASRPEGPRSAGDDDLSAIEPWRGLEAKVVLALEAGGVTPAMVPTLSDDELLAVAGIGPAALKKIRSAFSGDAG